MLMSANICPSEIPQFIRASGGVSASFALGHRGTRILDLHETGGFRFRFPTKDTHTCEAVLINTGGGMTGGDSLTLDITVNEGADVVLTTQAAEKIYRSEGTDTILETHIKAERNTTLAFVPQETILFSGAQVKRSLNVNLHTDAEFIAAESVVFGRSAMGEVLGQGAFKDRWRIRRDGKLIFAEDVKLNGSISDLLLQSAIANGAKACATVVMVSKQAEQRIEAARELLTGFKSEADSCSEAGISAWNGMLVLRILSKDASLLRTDLSRYLEWLRGTTLPIVWQC
jgi:urease accessory protein